MIKSEKKRSKQINKLILFFIILQFPEHHAHLFYVGKIRIINFIHCE